jgi:hypothetical protein
VVDVILEFETEPGEYTPLFEVAVEAVLRLCFVGLDVG